MSRARRLTGTVEVEPFDWGGSTAAPVTRPRSTPPAASRTPRDPEPAAVGSAQVAEIEREAFAKGFAQGERAGREAASQRAEAMVQRLTETLSELTQLRAQLIHQTERQMVELALAVARRVVHREVSIDPDLLVAMARVALERLGEAGQITVRLNPDDFQMVGAERTAGMNGSHVAVVADARIPRGGCRVESEMGILDAGIDAQIHEIAQALLGRADAAAGAPVVG